MTSSVRPEETQEDLVDRDRVVDSKVLISHSSLKAETVLSLILEICLEMLLAEVGDARRQNADATFLLISSSLLKTLFLVRKERYF